MRLEYATIHGARCTAEVTRALHEVIGDLLLAIMMCRMSSPGPFQEDTWEDAEGMRCV